jgi:enoyl-CoA hydratase/carnithine racemase
VTAKTDTVLIFDKPEDHIARITLNRSDVLNAVNLEMRDALWDALHAFNDDPDVHVAVIRGAGARAFSAGADISEFGTAPSYVEARRARHDRDVWGYMLSITKPIVAAMHGFAFGAGCELALCCDFRIAADDAQFALPEVKLGYIPSAGGTQLLPRTVSPGVARELILTGDAIDAQRALAIGLVTRVVSTAQLDHEALALARTLAALPQAPLRAAKEAMSVGADLPLDAALRLESMIADRVNGAPDRE